MIQDTAHYLEFHGFLNQLKLGYIVLNNEG